MLSRLATETGGRYPRNTNDMSLSFARAQRDQACRYTLGFYLSAIKEDRPRRVSVRVLRDGLRVLSPTQYMFRSESEKRSNEIMAAFFTPGAYHTGYVRTHVFPLQPRAGEVWDTLIAVSFPFRFDDAQSSVSIDFGAVLKRGSKVAHRFDRRMNLRLASDADAGERRFMFLEPADLAPGKYELTVVMAKADGAGRPDSTRLNVEVPPIPKKAVMLVDPILGKPRDENVLVRGDGPTVGRKRYDSHGLAKRDIMAGKGAFEPILVQLLEEEEEVLARNKTCLVGAKQQPDETYVHRLVVEKEGGSWRLPAVPLDLEAQTGNKKLLCQNLYELVPDEATEPSESYEFRTRVEQTPKIEAVHEEIPFAVVGEAQQTQSVGARTDEEQP